MKKKSRALTATSVTYLVFTIPALLLYTFFFVFSVLRGMYYSITDWNGINRFFSIIGLKNYQKIFSDAVFWRSLLITFKYAALLVSATILISLATALALNSLKIFKTFFKSVFFFPVMISSVTAALIWDQLFFRALPIAGSLFGLDLMSPLANPRFALPAVVFVNVWQAVCMPTIIFIAGLKSIPADIFDAADIDGCGVLSKFRFITLPYLIPTISVNFVLALKSGITTFDYVFALTQGGPARSTQVVGVTIYIDAFEGMRFALANAEAVLLFIIIAILSFIQIRLSAKKGINA